MSGREWMKTLILVRHGKSSWDHPGLADFDRPLAQRGLRDAPRMARRLRRAGARPDVIISSPAARANATAEIFADELALGDDRLIREPAIYAASWQELLDLVQGLHDSWQTVMLVGHNPGFTQLAAQLADDAPGNIVTSAWVVLALPVERWLDVRAGCRAELVYDFPKNPNSEFQSG